MEQEENDVSRDVIRSRIESAVSPRIRLHGKKLTRIASHNSVSCIVHTYLSTGTIKTLILSFNDAIERENNLAEAEILMLTPRRQY